MIRARDLDVLYVAGPGHGGPALVANAYLEGTYSEVYPHIERGRGRACGGCSASSRSRAASPATWRRKRPGRSTRAASSATHWPTPTGRPSTTPTCWSCCVVGDGEAETGPLAASWHSNKFLNPARDGAVLPILHLNGYKIANPTVLARIPEHELRSLLEGYGYAPQFVVRRRAGGDAPADGGDAGRVARRDRGDPGTPRDTNGVDRAADRWPMIVLRTPKGWTGPEGGGRPAGRGHVARSHQVPLDDVATNPEHLAQLETWMRSYRPEELFDDDGALRAELAALAPEGARRMGANPHANGGGCSARPRAARLPRLRGRR